MEITILGDTPSKKNSKNIFCRGTRPVVLSSKKHQEWHEQASWQIPKKHKLKLEKCSIVLTIYCKGKYKGDLTNKAESVMDLLVDNEVLVDDNWFICDDLHLKFGGVDKTNPRAEIVIHN